MSKTFQAACVQLRTGLEPAANVADAAALIREAHARGADFIATPEATVLFEADSDRLFAKTHAQGDDPSLHALRRLAEELSVWLLIGSMAIRTGERQCANRSFLIGPQGQIVATYDKIHMFDVTLPDGRVIRESSAYRPGERAVIAQTPWGGLGMSICYDLRFPQLYRMLAHAGAEMLAIPSAFTVPTGTAHWHVLMRARAIETGCWVLAAAQAGEHESGRKTYGHSLIVSPWGDVIAEADGVHPSVIVADVDWGAVLEARRRIPSLEHDRPVEVFGVDATNG